MNLSLATPIQLGDSAVMSLEVKADTADEHEAALRALVQ